MRRQDIILMIPVLVVMGVSACRKSSPQDITPAAFRAYDTEPDVNDPQRLISLHYEQAEGKRVFYDKCVWCHADATPAGPSNRSNLTPQPPLLSDGSVMNSVSDTFIRNIVNLGGGALGRSPMMPPWGNTLNDKEIRAVTAYVRAIAEPPYQASARPLSDYGVK